MSLLAVLLGPFRSVLAGSLRTIFEADVRHNPTIVNPIKQSDDYNNFQKEQQLGFAPQYVVSLRRPKTDLEAQRLYNHIRTVSWYLDAIPLLGRRLPFNIGVESIIGVIPGIGDYIGFLLSLYAVILSALFGLPLKVLGMMLINIIVDAFIGLIPVVGDALDVAFKANLRNLRLMEDHLISTNGVCHAGQFQIAFPPSNVFLPQDSPQRQQPMPEVSSWSTGTGQRREWDSTSSSNTTTSANRRFGTRQQDFHNGTMEEVVKYNQVGESSSTTIVPNEVFTTMRYEEQGITLHQMCAVIPTLSQRLQDNAKRECFPLLSRHIARLESSVEAMKEHFPLQWSRCPSLRESKIRKKLEGAVKEDDGKGSTRRIRVSVNQTGVIYVATFSMATTNTSSSLTVRFDNGLHDGEDQDCTPSMLYKYKTSHRQMYDDARLRVNATLGVNSGPQGEHRESCFDVIMLHSDSITESSIANFLVYQHKDGQIYTPPAGKLPLLPGLMRQELLSRGLVTEMVISKDQLQSDLSSNRVSLYLCNALRGIIPVTIVD